MPEGAELIADPDEVNSVHCVTPDEILPLSGLLVSNREFLDQIQTGAIQF